MAKNYGLIVEYKNKDGVKQKAELHKSDQKESFKALRKAFVRLINDDGTRKLSDTNQKMAALKNLADLTQIGFID